MKFNKLKAFTLAELMILLLTLSVLLAAFAPVFTKRVVEISSDDVWNFVPVDADGNAYYDDINRERSAQAFIGLSPIDAADVITKSSSVYSKLVIAASENLSQNHIQFRYSTNNNDKRGNVASTLYAGKGEIKFNGKAEDDEYDVVYGSIKSAKNGSKPSLINDLSSGDSIVEVGDNIKLGINALKGKFGNYNVIIGNLAGYTEASGMGSEYGNGNTAVGFKSLNLVASNSSSTVRGTGNTAVGAFALTSKIESGSYGQNYNTAIGYNSCSSVTGSYKTCIGYNSGQSGSGSLYNGDYERVFIGSAPAQNVEKVDRGKGDAGAVLEIHNINHVNSNSAPMSNVGDSSVVINGNLIVRGQPYFESPIRRGYDTKYTKDDSYSLRRGLVLYTAARSLKNEGVSVVTMHGYDGIQRTKASSADCRKEWGKDIRIRKHKYKNVRPNCICTGINSATSDTVFDPVKNVKISTSYDWASKTTTDSENHHSVYWDNCVNNDCAFDNGGDGCKYGFCDFDSSRTGEIYRGYITTYMDKSFAKQIGLLYRHMDVESGGFAYKWDKDQAAPENKMTKGQLGVDESFAHGRTAKASSGYWYDFTTEFVDPDHYRNGYKYPRQKFEEDYTTNYSWSNQSCCPVLTDYTKDWSSSDRRLKNIGEKFTAGLDEIKKLNIYNYTFKSDKNNIPHVGVIAQDLRLIFPSAVSKDENGFYHIRWDEMFYAAINAIKTLNSKVENIASKIANDKQRLANLKKDNAQLNAKLDQLADELTILEAKK